MSRTYTKDELKEILDKHGKWLRGEAEGARADLSYANLSYADLSYADLSYADLSYANLSYADLSYANLSYANLRYANLRYANLSYADLSYANLRYANLSYADLSYADLSYANLSYADLSYANLRYANLRSAKGYDDYVGHWIIPEEGEFIGWKAVRSKKNSRPIVLKLKIPPKANRSCCFASRKVRVERATPVAAFEKGGELCEERSFSSDFDGSVWTLGKERKVKDFVVDPNIECGPGLHLFITRKEAAKYLG